MTSARPIWTWLITIMIVVPAVATVVAATSVDFSQGPYGGGVTLDWLGAAWTLLGPNVVRSIIVGIVVAIANLILGGTLAYWAARTGSPLARAVVTLASIPLAIPGIAISVALIGAYSGLRPSGLLLICGHILFTLPFTLATLIPVIGDDELVESEQVAGSLGASEPRILATVTIPSITMPLAQAASMAYALSFGEFNVSFFVNPPATPMAPFALFDAYQTRRLEIASAETVLFILCAAPVVVMITWLRARTHRRKYRP